ncbi:ZTA1 [Sanghuangporus vaninii]
MSLPDKMKAIIIPKHGDVDVIELADVRLPTQQPGEVLVKVGYAGVNFIDTYMRKGLYPAQSFPFRIGQESSGTVVRPPSDASVLAEGEFKKRGIQEGAKVIARYTGSLAEYISVPWKDVHSLPSNIPLRDGAAVIIQGLTALTFATEAHNIQAGETILIHTIAGGFGLILAQIAKARGATVIGTTSTEEKAQFAKTYTGADHIILYTKEDTVKRVLQITQGEGVHAVFDGVGKDTFDSDFEMLRRKGTLISLGNASGPVPPFPPLKLTPKNIKLLRPTVANYIYTPSEFSHYVETFFSLVSSGAVKFKIFKEYPFTAEGVRQAQIDITGHSTIGKLVVKVSDD